MREHRTALMVFTVLMLVASGLAILPAAAATACDDAYVSVNGNTIKVAPTGVDDTANLQCALDLAATMPRAMVVLGEGDYFTSFLGVEGFNGVFKGAGRDLTTLSTLPEGLDCFEKWQATDEVHLVTFAGDGDVVVKGMTLGVAGDAACAEPWPSDEGFGEVSHEVDGLVFRPDFPVVGECGDAVNGSVRVDNVLFAGDPGTGNDAPDQGTHFWRAIIAGGSAYPGCIESRSTGDITVTNTVFDAVGVAVLVGWVDDSRVRIARNQMYSVFQGIVTRSASNTHIVIAKNVIEPTTSWGIVNIALSQLLGEHPYTVTVRDNTISNGRYGGGIAVFDFAREITGETSINMKVIRNIITLDSLADGVHIFGAGGGVLARNVVDGSGYAAATIRADAWKVSTNDLTGFDAYRADFWLLPNSYDNSVRCLTPDDTVVDDGTNNMTRGCSVLPSPLTATLAADSARFAATTDSAELLGLGR